MRGALAALVLLATSAPAAAADWLSIQNLEPDNPDKAALRGFGFLQVSAEGYPDAELDGQLPVFNTVDGTADWAVLLRRARVGVRGNLPGTDRASVQISAELGQNPLTTASGVWAPRLMDATMTLRSNQGVHLRLGRMKAPLNDESLEAFHIDADLIRFTRVTGQLLMERDASSGAFTGLIDGFRDTGAEVFGSHRSGTSEVSWALMGGTTSADPARLVLEPTVTGRVQVARLLGDLPARSPAREEAAAWVFGSVGTRDIGASEQADRLRAGVGAQLRASGLRLRTEGIYARGVLATGVSPPFPGGVRTLSEDGQAWGVTALASMRLQGRWELGATYSHLDLLPDEGADRRLFDDVIGHAQLHLSPKLWMDLNAGLRHAAAPEGSEAAQEILAAFSPYTGLMATAIW